MQLEISVENPSHRRETALMISLAIVLEPSLATLRDHRPSKGTVAL